MENTIIVCGDSGVGKKRFKNYVNDDRIIVTTSLVQTLYTDTQIKKCFMDFKGAFIMMSTDIQYTSLVIESYINLLRELDIKHIILLINKFDKEHKLDVSFYNKICNQFNIHGCIIVSSKTGFGINYCMAQMNNLLSKDIIEKNIEKVEPKLEVSDDEINEYIHNVYTITCGSDNDDNIKEIKVKLGAIYFDKDNEDIRELLSTNKELYNLMLQIQKVCLSENTNVLKCTKVQEILLNYGTKHL